MAIALRITIVQALDRVIQLATHRLMLLRILASLSVAQNGSAHSASSEIRLPAALIVVVKDRTPALVRELSEQNWE